MSSSNIEQMRMATPVKSGFYCKKKTLVIIAVVIGCLFIGTILATYFGTLASNKTTNKPSIEIIETTTQKPPMAKINYRLPTSIKPYLYELEIQPYIGPEEEYGSEKAWTFNGKMTMHLTCVKPTDQIIFHALELDIQGSNLELSKSNGELAGINKELEFDAEKQFVIVNLESECIEGADYKLVVPYSGIILEKLTGFYRSSYVENGTTYNIASTDFEPTDARRAFPCFDEPAMKARFQLTMIRHKNFTSTLFNTPLLSSSPHPNQPDWIVDQFGKSEIMSTYLVAFVISNFEQIETKSPKYNVDIAVAGRPLAIRDGEGELALDEAARIIDFYSDYFNVSYPMPKSTQVAIPDFNSGAMENWGLVFYRESALLYNPKTDTVKNKQRVSEVVAHELAHQWNGNLVTMAWWSDLWLNEGFASWVENLGKNHTHPEWRDLEYFFINSMQYVMFKDSLVSSHPIVQPVNNPSEIGGLFDKISYDKGSSIIRMMNSFLGERTFVRGVSNYLKKYSFGNAYQDDLWAELTKAAHEDGTLESSTSVKDIMDTWTLQKGYPVVTIEKNADDKVKVSQRWFLVNPLNTVVGTPEYEKYKWYVPITITTKQEKDFNFEKRPTWLKSTQDSLSIDIKSGDDDWIIGNVKHSAFYRVNYDDKNWKLLLEQFETDHTLIDATSRATLIDDSFNLGRAEIIDQTVYLNMVSYLSKEEDPLPFTSAFAGMEYMYDMLESDYETFKLFNEFYANLVKNAYERYGWNLTLTDANDINLQTSILRIMCRSGYQPCIDQARSYYNKWMNNDEALPSNFKNLIYSTVIEAGDEETWQGLFQKALKTKNEAEKLRILSALTKSKDLNILKFYLGQTSDDSVVKKQDEASIIRMIASNSYGRQLAFEYMDANWDTLLEKYGNVAFTLPAIVKTLTENFNTKFDKMKLERFVTDHPDTGIAASSLNEAAETISSNIRWMETNSQAIKNWLRLNSGAVKF